MRNRAKWLAGLVPVIAVSVMLGDEPADPNVLPDCGVSIELSGSHFPSAGYQTVILKSNGPETIYVPSPWPQGTRAERFVDGKWTEVLLPKDRSKILSYPPAVYEIEKHELSAILWDDVIVLDIDGKKTIQPGRYRFVLYFLPALPSQTKTGAVRWCRTKSKQFTLEKKAIITHVD